MFSRVFCSLEAVGENHSLPLPALIVGIPALPHSSPCSCGHTTSPYSFYIKYLFPYSFRILVIGFRTYSNNPGSSHLKILPLITSAKTLFQNKVTFIGSGDYIVNISFGGLHLTHYPLWGRYNDQNLMRMKLKLIVVKRLKKTHSFSVSKSCLKSAFVELQAC